MLGNAASPGHIFGMTSAEHDFVDAYLSRSAAAMAAMAGDQQISELLAQMAAATCRAMRSGHKLMIAGNGGSAGDSQHIAGEFISRLMFDHPPLPAIALTVDTSVLTAAANDYGFDCVFERQVRGLGQAGDVLLGISTSGRSPNLLRALDAARETGVHCLGFAGRSGGAMIERCELLFRAPSDETAIIQQLHITAAHVFCALVERAMFPDLVPG